MYSPFFHFCCVLNILSPLSSLANLFTASKISFYKTFFFLFYFLRNSISTVKNSSITYFKSTIQLGHQRSRFLQYLFLWWPDASFKALRSFRWIGKMDNVDLKSSSMMMTLHQIQFVLPFSYPIRLFHCSLEKKRTKTRSLCSVDLLLPKLFFDCY